MKPGPIDIDAVKKSLRATCRAAVAAMTPQQKGAESVEVCRRLMRLPEFASAKVVLLFASLADEPAIDSVAKHALAQRKTVLVPRVNWHDGSMVAALVQDWETDLVRDHRGLRSPRHDAYTYDRDSIHLAVVPGVAFSLTGVRLGRGGGFYDRFLPPIGFARRVGVCFRCQVVESLPLAPHDEPVRTVVHA